MAAPVALLSERPAMPRDAVAASPGARGETAPALVVGADINGLGVVRSLARKGVPVWLADCDPKHPTMRTRHAGKIVVQSLTGAAVIDELVRLRARFATNPVLFLTREETVAAVSAALDRVVPHYRISMPEARLMSRLMDKVQFQALAQQHGFAIPRAVLFAGPADLAAADAPAYPCVLKPAVKTPRYAARFRKAYKVADRSTLEGLVREIDGAAPMIAQEWIEGGDDRLYFCLQYRGRKPGAAVGFTGRKLRSWPPATGGTASCAPAPEAAEELSRLTEAFFAAVGFFGIGSMEFKQDARSGRYLMIEPTVGRTDFQEEIATLNGVNIPYAAYCGELGRSLRGALENAAPAAWAEARIDRWASGRRARRRFPCGLRRYDALWRLDDPLPGWLAMAGRLRARAARLRRVRR